jgi:hypothetical protein
MGACAGNVYSPEPLVATRVNGHSRRAVIVVAEVTDSRRQEWPLVEGADRGAGPSVYLCVLRVSLPLQGGMSPHRLKYALSPRPCLAMCSRSSTLANPDSRARSYVISATAIGAIESTTMWPSSIW